MTTYHITYAPLTNMDNIQRETLTTAADEHTLRGWYVSNACWIISVVVVS